MLMTAIGLHISILADANVFRVRVVRLFGASFGRWKINEVDKRYES